MHIDHTLARKEFQTDDSYFNMFTSTEINQYVVFDPVNSYPMERLGEKANYLLEYQLNMDPVKRVVKRTAWNFLDFLGLVGGVSGSVGIIFVLFLDPISDHLFVT
jgi:hypothetical protein